jgi:Lon protease-like protein
MIKQCLREKTEFGIVSIIKDQYGNADNLSSSFSKIGTLAQIEDFDPVQPALYMTKSFGTQRFKLLSSAQEKNGLWVGEVELLENDPITPIPQEHLGVAVRVDVPMIG